MRMIHSLLDLDFYKLTMGQVQWHNYRDVHARFAFHNRTHSVRLAEAIPMDMLIQHLDHVRTLRATDDELHYLGEIDCGDRSMFAPAYIDWFAQLQLPPYKLEADNGQFKLTFAGAWPQVTFWETIALSIVNGLYYSSVLSSEHYAEAYVEGRRRLMEKIQRIRTECPDLKFSDFGTRRRFAIDWQDEVVGTVVRELPNNFLGTSCVDIARRRGVKPMGTSAHEMYMVMAGLAYGSDENIRNSHNRVLQDWWASYGRELSIALTDTYGTGFFFRDMTRKQALQWKGLRHDSGDPIAFGERAIEFYQGYGIDATKKTVVFSDGLDLDTMLRIQKHFAGRINTTTFGWGTNLTNDMGYPALSLVVKVAQVNGNPTVKLSDNLAKATGPQAEVDRYRRVFGYTSTLNEECTY